MAVLGMLLSIDVSLQHNIYHTTSDYSMIIVKFSDFVFFFFDPRLQNLWEPWEIT